MAATSADEIFPDFVLALMALGKATWNGTFHITSDAPLSLADVLSELTPIKGVAIGIGNTEAGTNKMAEAARASLATALVIRRLRYYLPYFSFVRRFDRRHAALGSSPARSGIDVEGLRGYIESFLLQKFAGTGNAYAT